MPYPEDFDELFVSSKSQFARLDPKTQVASCLHRLEAEVNNGGFHQFFSNSTGEYVRETIQALNDIGAVKTAELVQRAVAIGFPAGYPANAGEYQLHVAAYDDVAGDLEPLDQEFFEYAEPLTNLVNEYLARGA